MASVPKEIIDVLIAEALGEGPTGIAAVAHVINRRAQLRGETPLEVVTDDGQFSGYKRPGAAVRQSMNDPQIRQQVESIWQGVVSGEVANPYPNADFFHTPAVNPNWSKEYERVGQTGNHIFYVSDQSAKDAATNVAPKPAERINRTLTGGKEAYAASQEIRLAPFRYEYGGSTKRDLPINDALQRQLTESVTAVYGPDYTVGVMSGAQGEGSNGQTGTRRHGTGVAGDIWVYDPSGKRLSGDALVPLAQHWLANDIGSVGFPNNGNSLHLDLIGGNVDGSVPLGSKEGRLWYYGIPSANQRELLTASLTNGTLPNYAFDPAQVARGLIPPGNIPNVVGSLLDVAPTPAIRRGLLESMKEGPPMPPPRIDGVGQGATRTDLNKLRGLDQAYPVSQTKRPRPESYAGMERGETRGMAGTQSQRRNASPAEMMAFQSLGQSPADGPLVSTRRSLPVRSIADLAEIYSQGGPTRPGTNVQRAPSLVSSLLDSAGDVPMLSSISRAPRIQNLRPGLDTSLTQINDYTPVTTRDSSKVLSIADIMWGDEFTTELPGGTRKRIPSAGLVGEQAEPMPIGATTRAGPTRPASLLAAITGDNGTTWNAAQDGPAKRVGSFLTRKYPLNVPTNGGFAGQERGEMVRTPNQGTMTASNTPGIFRIAGLNGTAGNVGLPNGVRPNVDIPSFTEDFAGPSPNPKPWTRVGTEAMSPDIFKPTPKPTALERKPNPFEFVPPPTGLTKPQPTGQQGNQGLTAVSNVPQFRTVMQTERYENPAYKTWKANQNATRDDIPLGEMVYGARSRDSVAQAAAGQNFVNTQMPQQWLTRQVPVQVPIEPAKPVVKPIAQAAPVVAPVVGAKPRLAPAAQAVWSNPIQGLLGAIAPAGGPVSSLLQSLTRPPSEYFLTATGFLDDGISENHRTPSIGVMK